MKAQPTKPKIDSVRDLANIVAEREQVLIAARGETYLSTLYASQGLARGGAFSIIDSARKISALQFELGKLNADSAALRPIYDPNASAGTPPIGFTSRGAMPPEHLFGIATPGAIDAVVRNAAQPPKPPAPVSQLDRDKAELATLKTKIAGMPTGAAGKNKLLNEAFALIQKIDNAS
jgi:hypothetical protein